MDSQSTFKIVMSKQDILEAKVKELKQEYGQGEILLNYIESRHLEYKLQGQSTFNVTIGILNV